MPFSLPLGFILAKDGAGVKYEHKVHEEYLNLYGYWIKAVENSLTDSNKDGFGDVNKKDDDILALGNQFTFEKKYNFEIYYVLRYNDNQQEESNQTPEVLHWIGLQNKNTLSSFKTDISFITNFGKIKGKEVSKDILAFLWSTQLSYQFNDFEVGIHHEGATGFLPRTPNRSNSFQTIASSHGSSFIFIDDSGGLSINSSSNLSGLYASSLYFILLFFEPVIFELKYSHFRSFEKISYLNNSSNYLGDECDLSFRYEFLEKLNLDIELGLFFPNTGYENWVKLSSKIPVIETKFSVRAEY